MNIKLSSQKETSKDEFKFILKIFLFIFDLVIDRLVRIYMNIIGEKNISL